MNTEIQAPELPAAFIERISSMGGSASEAVLAMRKQLTSDDVSHYNNELQIGVPIGQLENSPFILNNDEKERLESEMKVRVLMLDSSCIDTAPYYVNLGRSYYCYCLRTNWGEVVERNDLREGTVIQLWSFRVGSESCFALVLEEPFVFLGFRN